MLLGSDQHVLRDEPGLGLFWVLWLVRLCDHAAAVPAVRRTVGECFTVPRQFGGYCRYATETGTHSLKLCIMDWIDMPVVVHVNVVDISGVAQTQILMVHFSRDSTVTVH